MKRHALLLTVLAFVACGKKTPPLILPFNSLAELAEHHLRCIEINDRRCLIDRILTKREFHDSVYSYLPESTDKHGTIDEDVYWGWTFPDRQKAFKKLFERFGGRKLLGFSIGKPKKIMKLNGVNLYRDTPIFAEFSGPTEIGNLKLNTSEILKAVVEVRGGYKLWNTTYE